MKNILLTTFIVLQTVSYVYPLCRPLDDVAFNGIFGNIYIREQYCSNSDFSEVRNYISTRISNDGLMKIENSDIGSIKPELVANNKASQIITFTCINCNIKTIEKEGLKKLVKLYNLTLYGNDLGEFDGTFIKNDNLRFRYLNLTNNNIKKVENVCLGLPSIKTIVLRDNPIQDLNENIFKDCKNLEFLDISNTSIKITKNMFANNTNLMELYLQNVNLNNLEEIYITIPNLTSLDVSHNKFSSFDTNLFNYFQNLKIFNLDNNKISSITYSAKTKTFSLRQLYLSNNNISNISVVNLEYFKELQTLDLSYNQIQEIPVHFFEHCVDLRHLLIRNNYLKKLPVGVFSPTSNIVQLDISYNNFSTFDDHMLNSLHFLEEFYVSGNNITSFEPYTLGSMVSTLKKLGISDLKWSCETLSYFVRFCKANNIDCKPGKGANYKTANVQGIECSENKTEEKHTYRPYDSNLNAEYINLTRINLLEQISLYKMQIGELSSLNVILVLLTLLVMVFVIYKVVTPIFFTYYNRYKAKRDGLKSAHLNVSHMELMQNHGYGHST